MLFSIRPYRRFRALRRDAQGKSPPQAITGPLCGFVSVAVSRVEANSIVPKSAVGVWHWYTLANLPLEQPKEA
jgi:hypothetical protein